MAGKLTLFTRYLKGFMVAEGGVIPSDATSAVELETGSNHGWKAKKVDLTPPVIPEPEPEG